MVPRLAYGLFCAAALMALPSLAHHSYAAYDLIHTRTLEGTVEAFQWSNPHSTFTIVLKPDGRSEPIRWSIITSSPAILKRFGWTQDSLKPGARVSVLCNPMTDGSHGGRLHTVVLLDTGQVLRTKLSADTSSSAGPFAYPYARPASASQARGPDSPLGFRARTLINPLRHPCRKLERARFTIRTDRREPQLAL